MKLRNRKLSKSSAAWVRRQLDDPFVERARREGFRARAAFKLQEIDGRFHILRSGQAVVDLGAAPGSWSQHVRRAFPKSRVLAIDLLPVGPIAGVEFFQGDFTECAALEWLGGKLGPRGADVVLSDMAPNTTGHQKTDHLRQAALVEYALDFAKTALKPGGSFVAKSFTGGATPALMAEIRRHFSAARLFKPESSRKASVEMFIVATGFQCS